MKKYITPQIFNEFNKYLTDTKNDINVFNLQKFKDYSNSYLSFLNEIFEDNFHKQNNYSDEHIAERIFLTKIKDFKEFIKCNILAIIKTFTRIESNIELLCNMKKQQRLFNEIRLFSDFLSNSIAFLHSTDLKYNGEKTKYPVIRSNFVNSSQIYEASKQLFHENIDDKSWSITAIRNTSIFLIRQSIELKIKNSIGLNRVVDSNGNPIKFKHDIIIDFIKEYENYFEFPVKFSILNKIYNWTNYYIHNGIFDYYWLIDWSHIILNPLFAPFRNETVLDQLKKGSIKIKEKTEAFNVFGAIKIQRDFYKLDLTNKLIDYISNNTNYSSDDIELIFDSKIEAMLFD